VTRAGSREPASTNTLLPLARGQAVAAATQRTRGVAGQQASFAEQGPLLRHHIGGQRTWRPAAPGCRRWPWLSAADQAISAGSAPASPASGPRPVSKPCGPWLGAAAQQRTQAGGRAAVRGVQVRFRQPQPGRRRLQGAPRIGWSQASQRLDSATPQGLACAAWGVSWLVARKAQMGKSGWGLWVREEQQVEGATGGRFDNRPEK